MKKKFREWQCKSCLFLFLVLVGGAIPIATTQANPKAILKPLNWSLSGKVVGVSGEALPGVTVILKATSIGTQTGLDGSYTLNVPKTNGILVFSFIGYTTTEKPYSGPGTFNVSLSDDTKALAEVVVTSYTTQRKKDLTGAVAVVDVQALQS